MMRRVHTRVREADDRGRSKGSSCRAPAYEAASVATRRVCRSDGGRSAACAPGLIRQQIQAARADCARARGHVRARPRPGGVPACSGSTTRNRAYASARPRRPARRAEPFPGITDNWRRPSRAATTYCSMGVPSSGGATGSMITGPRSAFDSAGMSRGTQDGRQVRVLARASSCGSTLATTFDSAGMPDRASCSSRCVRSVRSPSLPAALLPSAVERLLRPPGTSLGSISPCRRHPTRRSQLRAETVGASSVRAAGVRPCGRRHPSNQAPDEYGSIPVSRAPCLLALHSTYARALRTSRGEESTRAW
jgi:hypothetical protein